MAIETWFPIWSVQKKLTLRQLGNWEYIANSECCLLSAVDESTSVEALSSNESLVPELVAVRVTEDDTGEGSTTVGASLSTQAQHHRLSYSPARIVDNLFHNAANVPVALSKIERTEAGRVLVQASVGLEDGMRTPLRTNNATHLGLWLYFAGSQLCCCQRCEDQRQIPSIHPHDAHPAFNHSHCHLLSP